MAPRIDTECSLPADEYDHLFKITLIGDSGVGKSCLVQRLVDDPFSEPHLTTIGVDFRTTFFDINGSRTKVQVWDTAGQERFQSIVKTYYRGANGVAVVYDATDPTTFEHVQKWVEEVRQVARKDVAILVIGNKADLKSVGNNFGSRVVNAVEAEQWCRSRGLLWIETSAKKDVNVSRAFEQLAGECYNRIPAPVDGKDENTSISGTPSLKRRKGSIRTLKENNSSKPKRWYQSFCTFL